MAYPVSDDGVPSLLSSSFSVTGMPSVPIPVPLASLDDREADDRSEIRRLLRPSPFPGSSGGVSAPLRHTFGSTVLRMMRGGGCGDGVYSSPMSLSLSLLRASRLGVDDGDDCDGVAGAVHSCSLMPSALDPFFPSGDDPVVTFRAYVASHVVLTSFSMMILGIIHDLSAMMVSTDHVGVCVGTGVWSSSTSYERSISHVDDLMEDMGGKSVRVSGLSNQMSTRDGFVRRLNEFADWSVLLHEDLCLYIACLSSQQALFSSIYHGYVSGRHVYGEICDPSPSRVPLMVGTDCSSSSFLDALSRLDDLSSDLSSSSVFRRGHPIHKVVDRLRDNYCSMLESAGYEVPDDSCKENVDPDPAAAPDSDSEGVVGDVVGGASAPLSDRENWMGAEDLPPGLLW